jgi:outer membrane protein assembly factor BamB
VEPLAAGDPWQVGAYRLRARLGSGGMGQVFLGYSPAGRAVAVKVIHPELAKDPMFRTRFRREVAAAKAVSGAYTAPVTAAGPDDDPPWLATAFVPGPSLAGVIAAAGPLPEPSVWKLTAGLVEALQAVHAAGLVHRDLKPANVLLATDGPRVIDFGISAAFEGTRMTSTGLIIGTPSFMSPEQAEGARVGPESDVFSLGCVIVFAATGAGPFGDGQLASVLYRVVHTQPALDEVPRGLREVAAACLAKAPADRPTLAWLVDAVAASLEPDASTGLTSFWPMAVTRLIGSYQDQLSTEMPAAPSVAETVAPQSASAAQAAASAPPPATMAAPHAGAAHASAASGGPGPLTVGAAELAIGPGALTVGAADLGLDATGLAAGAGHVDGLAGGGPAGAAAASMVAPQGSVAPPGAVVPSPGLAASSASAAGSAAPGVPAAPAGQAGEAGPAGAYAGPIYGTYGMPAPGSPAAFPDGYRTAVQSQFPVLPGDLAGRPGPKDGVTRRRLLVALGLTAAAGAGGAAWELTRGSKPGNLAGNKSTGKKPAARPTHHAATQQTPSPAASGKQVWSFGTGNIIESPVVVANGVVYFGSTDNNVYAVNAHNGDRVWSYGAGDAVQTGIAVADGAVYASSFEGDLFSLDASSGTRIWSYPAQSVSAASVAVADGTVYTSGLGAIIMALSVSNGTKKWDLAQDGEGMRGIALAGHVVYLGTSGGDVYALHGGGGKVIWSFPANGEITSGVAFADGVVYAGSFGQSIYALNARNGRQVWTYQTGGQVASGIAVANGIVYAASADSNLYALSASGGKVVWKLPTSGQVQSGIAVANGTVYAGDSSGNLYAVNARNGHKIWEYALAGVIESGIAVANGIVYFGGGNILYAVRA